MSRGDGAIEVSMAELVATSLVENIQVDLDLNVDPPFSSDGLALELALGGQDFEGSVQVSRQNWPRFEPGMSELLAQEEENSPADSRGLDDLTQYVASPSAMPRVLDDLIQDGTSPSARPSVFADLLHGGTRSYAIPRVPANLLHGGTSPLAMPGVSASLCNGDTSQSAMPGVSASLLHGGICPSAMPRVSAGALHDPRNLSAMRRVLADFLHDGRSPTAMPRVLADLLHDGTSPSAMSRVSADLLHNSTSPPSMPTVLVNDCANTFAMPRALSHLLHDGTHSSTTHRDLLDVLNIYTSPFPVSRVSSDRRQDSPNPSPIPRVSPDLLLDGSSLPLMPLVSMGLIQEGRSSLCPTRRISDELPHQSTSPSPVSSQASVSEHLNLDPLQGYDLDPFFLSSGRLSRSPLHWRRARRRITPILNRAEAQLLSAGRALTGQATRAHDARPSLGIHRLSGHSRNAESGTTCLDMSSAAVAISNSESNHENVKETETGSAGAHFECNICLEMAMEPVVSCCGHLFCWPCLYQWLHVHSVGKECPVCKGSLSDNAITPIYGRGNVQDTASSPGNIPPRPHGHRMSNKGCPQEHITHERLARDLGIAGEASRVNVGLERNDSEGLRVVILERLRVAERLQQELLEGRSRLGQRLMGRRGGGVRSPGVNAAVTEATLRSVFPETRELGQRTRHSFETAANNLAAIRASIDGLRANMQGLVEFVSSVPRRNGAPILDESISSTSPNVVEPLLDEERAPPPRTDLHLPGHLRSTGGQPQEGSAESQREWRRAAASGASGSCDAEPGSLHARKRRRLD